MGSNNYIEICNITKWYPVKKDIKTLRKEKQWIKAVDDVSISIQKGEVLGVLGNKLAMVSRRTGAVTVVGYLISRY